MRVRSNVVKNGLPWCALLTLVCHATLCIAAVADEPTPFELKGWKPEPARRTLWTRWLNTFDFRKGAGDPDFYRRSGFMAERPGNYRTMDEGRFGEVGAPLYPIGGKRTQMKYRMGGNCGRWRATIEMFVRSRPGLNIWNDGKDHHLFHLYEPQGRNLRGTPGVDLVKTGRNTLAYSCQGTTIELPVENLQPDAWYHAGLKGSGVFVLAPRRSIPTPTELTLREEVKGSGVFALTVWQSHEGAKDGSTPKVLYGFDEEADAGSIYRIPGRIPGNSGGNSGDTIPILAYSGNSGDTIPILTN